MQKNSVQKGIGQSNSNNRWLTQWATYTGAKQEIIPEINPTRMKLTPSSNGKTEACWKSHNRVKGDLLPFSDNYYMVGIV